MPSSPRKPASAHAEGFRKLLVAADGSEPSLRAIDVAAEMAARYGAALHGMLVVEIPPPTDPELPAEALTLEAVADRQRLSAVEGVVTHGRLSSPTWPILVRRRGRRPISVAVDSIFL